MPDVVPCDKSQSESPVSELEAEKKEWRQNPGVLYVVTTKGKDGTLITSVLLVYTANAARRHRETGCGKVHKVPRGGLEQKDKGCIVTCALREGREETGITPPKSAQVGPTFGPVYIPWTDDERGNPSKQPFRMGRANWVVVVRWSAEKLPRVKRCTEEIADCVWVHSLERFKALIAGNHPDLHALLLKAVTEAKVWDNDRADAAGA